MDENNSSEIYVNNINYNIKVFELNDNNNTISNLLNGTDKKKVARKRWAILAKALKVPDRDCLNSFSFLSFPTTPIDLSMNLISSSKKNS